MKKILMLNIMILILSLSACGGSDKDNTGTDPAASQNQLSVSQDIEDRDSEESSDESENDNVTDEDAATADNNGNAASNPASEADTDTEPDGFEVITTVSSDRENGGYTRYFSDVESFLEAYGFDINSDIPLLEYSVPDTDLDLYLYYNPETHMGCGYQLRQEEPDMPDYAFAFDDFQEATWDKDYYSLVSFYGDDGSDHVEDYRTNIVYDDNGKLLQFESTGLIDWLSEDGREEPFTILSFTYQYDDNEVLRYRAYSHCSWIFGTALQSLRSYFDELGRPVYERGYITHGYLEYYYIYTDNETVPTYCLCLDYMGTKYPDFTIYTH